MCDGQRRCTEVLGKKPAQVPARYTEPVGELSYITIVKRAAGNELQATPHRSGRSAPCRRARRTFGPAPEARPVPGFACGSSTRVKRDIFTFRRDCRTNRTAVDAGRQYTDKELTVETGVSRQSRPFTDFLAKHCLKTQNPGISIRREEIKTSQNRTYTLKARISLICRCRPCTCT